MTAADIVSEPGRSLRDEGVWVHESHRSYRWLTSFAWLPVRTLDQGWIWLRAYRRFQQSWGWGFYDDWAYATATPKVGSEP